MKCLILLLKSRVIKITKEGFYMINLRSKCNAVLLKELKQHVAREREILMIVLAYLREVDDRKLHLEMGFGDFHVFCEKELGYSSGSAYRRIAAMRLIAAVPEAESELESGALGLENASRAQRQFGREDKRRRKIGKPKLSRAAKQGIVESLLGKSVKEGDALLSEALPGVAEAAVEKMKPLPGKKTLIQFVASPELMGKLEELKGRLAHSNFEGRMDVLIERLADQALEKLRPKAAIRAKVEPIVANEARATPSKGPKRSRYVTAAERRKMDERERSCAYKDPKTGRVCGSQYGLQRDHEVLFSEGGPNTAENLSWKCGPHNRLRTEQMDFL
jgi:hypothetical protein